MTSSSRVRRLRNNKYGTPVPESVKHGIYAYQIYGCRCQTCQIAKSEANIRQKARRSEEALQRKREQDLRYVHKWREKARGHWHDDRETGKTTVHWPPENLSEPWLCPVCDEKFDPR